MSNSISGIGSMMQMSQMNQIGQMRPKGERTLTADQKTKVQDILSKYDSSNLTETDAKAMFKSFEEAGIKGPGLRDAIQQAGFDADKVFSLSHDGQQPPQGGPGGPGGMMGGGSLNVSALQNLQSILSQYDLSNLSSDQQTELTQKLSQAGLNQSGSLFNIGA
jgi:hypothetical protein